MHLNNAIGRLNGVAVNSAELGSTQALAVHLAVLRLAVLDITASVTALEAQVAVLFRRWQPQQLSDSHRRVDVCAEGSR